MTSVSLNNTLASLPMLVATFLPCTTAAQSQNLQKHDTTCVFGPMLYVKNAFLWVEMVLTSSLWCLDDLREPQQHVSLIAHVICNVFAIHN